MRPVRAASAAALLIAAAGCAMPPPAPPTEVRTDSEATSPERRARVHLELASAYLARGQAQTALDEVKATLAAKPDLPEAYNVGGLAYAALGDPRRAEESFRRALQLDPRDADTMNNFGWFLCQQRRFGEADAQFVAALAQPQYQGTVRTLLVQGACQADAGDWPAAEKSLSRGYELDPSNPVLAYNLSSVLYRRGELDRARFYIRRVNALPEQSNAQTLWLAVRIERRAGNAAEMQELARQLRDRFPKSPEALLLEQGRFDE